MKIKELIDTFENKVSPTIAFENDPIGLQIGDITRPVKRVLVTLDVRPEVVEEAISQKCDFIFSHHPVIFRPIHNLDLSIAQNKMYADLIQHSIGVYSAHTNLDVVEGGMNDWLASAMELEEVQQVTSYRYQCNIGRIGRLNQPIKLIEFANKLKETFNLDGLRLVAKNPDEVVQTVGVVGGDGGKFYPDFIRQGADVLVTGDVYYHTGHDMLADGINVIDVGHNVEKICIPELINWFNQWKDEYNWDVNFIASTVNTNPYRFL